MSYFDPRENGRALRKAINQRARANDVIYVPMDDNQGCYIADVFCDWNGVRRFFEFEFTPNQIDYNGIHVREILGSRQKAINIDWKTYCWAVRTLSDHQVMQKIVKSVEYERLNNARIT